MKKFDLIILTTAVNRSDLHTLCLSPITSLLKELRVKWLINIDKVSDESVTDTENNLKKILNAANIDLEIFHSTRPCFFTAVKMLSQKASHYLSKTRYGVFILEDDWPVKIDPNTVELKTLLDTCLMTDGDYISFKNRNELNFNPSIFSKHLFNVNFIGGFAKNVYEPRDPELIVCDAAWLDENGTRSESLKPTKIHEYDWFYGPEVGREWVKNTLKKRKWNKWNKGSGHDPMSNLTYWN